MRPIQTKEQERGNKLYNAWWFGFFLFIFILIGFLFRSLAFIISAIIVNIVFWIYFLIFGKKLKDLKTLRKNG